MYFPDDLVEEIRLRNDIVDVIGSYVHLKKSGGNYVGLCPFHLEKTPSFSVNGQRQIFKCFGCGVGGNVYTFLMNYENLTFQEAVKMLADRSGITIPEKEYSGADKILKEKKEQVLKINKEAAKFYFAQLKSPYGKTGYDYLLKRGLSDDTIKNFGLGFAVTGTNTLYNYLKSLPDEFSDEALKESGIFSFSEKQGFRDKFWNRVIFPIMDVSNKVIAFGGRVMSEGAYTDGDKKIPKYLNSPETIVFDKGRNLYALNIAKRTRKDYFLMCEGYIDVISLHQAGFDMALASLGTSLTPMQANLIKRYKEKVYITYDSDEAGQKAALRAIPILKGAGLSVKVINLKPYKDPDEFIKNLGEKEFEKRIENAEGSFFYEVSAIERGYDLKDPEQKTKFCVEIASKISKFEDELERNNYIQAVSLRYRLDESSLTKLMKKQAMKTENIPEYTRPKSGIGKKENLIDEAHKITQRTLLTWLCDSPKDYAKIKPYISSDDFSGEVYKNASALLFEQIESGEINIAKIISCFTDADEQQQAAALFSTKADEPAEGDKPHTLKMLVTKVMEQSIERMQKNGSPEGSDMALLIDRKKKIQELKKDTGW